MAFIYTLVLKQYSLSLPILIYPGDLKLSLFCIPVIVNMSIQN